MTTPRTAYTHLTTTLTSLLRTQILEIEILSSSHFHPSTPPTLLHDAEANAIGIPKALLIAAFRHALGILALDFRSPAVARSVIDGEKAAQNEENEVLTATLPVLLLTPEHITAANIRKRHLRSLYTNVTCSSISQARRRLDQGQGQGQHASSHPSEQPPHPQPQSQQEQEQQQQHYSSENENASKSRSDEFTAALTFELNLLTSLLTSPLHKHAKSPTLWAHRRWVLVTFEREVRALLLAATAQGGEISPGYDFDSDSYVDAEEDGRSGGSGSRRGNGGKDADGANVKSVEANANTNRLLDNEITIVSKAALQHPRNYVAFDHLRRIVSSSLQLHPNNSLLLSRKAYALALQNPSDTSMWSFWQFTTTTTTPTLSTLHTTDVNVNDNTHISNTTTRTSTKGLNNETETRITRLISLALSLRWRGEAIWNCLRCALASREGMGMGEEARRRGVGLLRELVEHGHGLRDVGGGEDVAGEVALIARDGRGKESNRDLDVKARDVEELRTRIQQALGWIDRNWKDD